MPAQTQPGTLFVVATPIGNLEDVTLRALRVLRECGVIAAEDTRHTRKLLSHFDIHTPQVSLHEHSTDAVIEGLVGRLLNGQDVAQVTDAGTPGVSDPGHRLIAAAVEAGVAVCPVPGASALLTAIVGSAMPMDRFRFAGFLPRQGRARRDLLARLAEAEETLVFFEAPHRLLKTLADLAAAFGDRPACAAREMTKVHEEFIRAPLDELVGRLPDPIRGEWSLVVAGKGLRAPVGDEADGGKPAWPQALAARLAAGESLRDAVRLVAEESGAPRKEVYAEALRLREAGAV